MPASRHTPISRRSAPVNPNVRIRGFCRAAGPFGYPGLPGAGRWYAEQAPLARPALGSGTHVDLNTDGFGVRPLHVRFSVNILVRPGTPEHRALVFHREHPGERAVDGDIPI